MGTVLYEDDNYDSVIAAIVLGVIFASVAGAGIALVVMIHLRKKKRGEASARGKKGGHIFWFESFTAG